MFGHTMLLIQQGGMIPLINYVAQTNILREVGFSRELPESTSVRIFLVQLFGGKNKQ